MFKPVIDNQKYLISLDGEVKAVDGSACTPPIKDGKVYLALFGLEQWYDLDWLALMSYYEFSIPAGFVNGHLNVEFSPINPKPTKSRTGRVMVFSRPFVIEKRFRIIPGFTRYAVSAIGEIIDVATRSMVEVYWPPSDPHYPMVDVYNPEKSETRSELLHRLVALAWIRNKDFVERPIINHKDGNRRNCDKRNLEWVSYRENANHAFETGLRDDNQPCRVRDVFTQEVTEFYSVATACKYMGIDPRPWRLLKPVRPSKLLEGRYEIKLMDDTAPWFYEGVDRPKSVGRYTVTVTYPEGQQETFHDVRQIIRKLKLWNIGTSSIKRVIEVATERYPGIEFSVVDHYETRKIQVIDVETLVVTEYPTIRLASQATGVHKSNILSRLKMNETQVLGKFAFRYEVDRPWDTNFTISDFTPKCILATHQSTNEVLEFKSLREAAKHFAVDRSRIKNRIKDQAPYNDWVFREVETLTNGRPL